MEPRYTTCPVAYPTHQKYCSSINYYALDHYQVGDRNN